MEQELKQMFEKKESEMSVPPTMTRELRSRVGRQRMVTGGLVAVAVVALAFGGFAGARSLSSDDALPPAREDSNVSQLVDTWTTTDADGRTRTMVIRATSDEDIYEIRLENHLALVCSGAPSTLTGTGRLFGTTHLAFYSPEITCDDGSKAGVEGFAESAEELLSDLTFDHDPESDILTNYSPFEHRRVAKDGQVIYSGRTLVWRRAAAENRTGDAGGWITYGDKSGIWARDLTNPDDPSDRVRLSSTPGSPRAWSPDGSKLLFLRDVKHSNSGGMIKSDLFVLNADGTETHLTRANGYVTGGSFSPDGSKIVYAEEGEQSSIAVIDASGGTPHVLRTHDTRSSEPCCLYGATFSPDGTQVAFFEGMYDHSNTLQVMNANGSGSRTVIEKEFGHIRGLQWSPDGSQLVFASGGMWVVGADGTGLMQVSTEETMSDNADPHWSPDGSRIAYTLGDPQTSEGGSLEIIRLDDLQIQNFGDGASGPWTMDEP